MATSWVTLCMLQHLLSSRLLSVSRLFTICFVFFFSDFFSSCHAPRFCRLKVRQTPPHTTTIPSQNCTLPKSTSSAPLARRYFSTCNDSLRISISTSKPGHLNLKRTQTNMIIVCKRPALTYLIFHFGFFFPPSLILLRRAL